jgi:hypothetical protein
MLIGSIPGELSRAGCWQRIPEGGFSFYLTDVLVVLYTSSMMHQLTIKSRHMPCSGNVEPNAEFQLTSEGVRQRLRSQSEDQQSSRSSEDGIPCAPANCSAPYLWLAHPTEGEHVDVFRTDARARIRKTKLAFALLNNSKFVHMCPRASRENTHTPLEFHNQQTRTLGTSPGNLRTYAGATDMLFVVFSPCVQCVPNRL